MLILLRLCFNTKPEQGRVDTIIRNSIHQLNNKEIYLGSNEYLELTRIIEERVLLFTIPVCEQIFKEIVELLM